MQQPINPSIRGYYEVGFHEDPLMVSWLFLANLTLLVGVAKWHKYYFYLHALLGLVIIGLTLAATLHVLFQVGIYYKPKKRFQLIHNIGGLIVVLWLSIQLLTGIISRVVLYSGKTSPTVCKWTKRVHQYSSYLIMILAKFQYLIINYRRNKWSEIVMYLFIDAVFIGLYLWLKFGYRRLEESVRDGQMIKYGDGMEEINQNGILTTIWFELKSKVRQIKGEYKSKSFQVPSTKYLAVVYTQQKEIPISHYILFNDYVYDISQLNEIHPGGQHVIQQVKNRQADRYLYGFYPSQTTQPMVIHKHTKDSLRICGPPIARIQRQSPIQGFKGQLMMVQISHCAQIDNKSTLFSLYLRPVALSSQNWTRFKFNGYTRQQQLGQYFSLTIGDKDGKNKLTRLYTSIWCMRLRNITFMRLNYPSLFGKMQIDYDDVIQSSTNEVRGQEAVMLVIKKYEKGEFTSRLFNTENNQENKLILSKPMGAGLRYQELSQEGRVIMVCGGTGILPFCDLIDLLFKRVKYLQKTNLSQALKQNDLIIAQEIIQNRQFSIYYACDILQDCPALIFGQLNYLSQSKFIKFNTIFRIKHVDVETINRYSHIKFQKQYFISQIDTICKEKHRINHVYICGPHRMNYAISQVLIDNQINQQDWTFV